MLKFTSALVLSVFGLFWGITAVGVQAQDSDPAPIFTLPGTCLVTPERVVAADGKVYALPGGEPVFDLPMPIDTTLHQTSPDGRYLAGATIGLFDLTTGEVVRDLNPESPMIAFSPDSRLIYDQDAVYLTSTGEAVLDLSATVDTDGVEVTTYAEFLPNSDIFVRYTRMTSPTTSTSAVAYSGQDFTPIFDTRDYAAPYAFHQFNADMSLVAIGNAGVFTYPDMEMVYDLGNRIGLWAYFSEDEGRLAVASVMPLGTYPIVRLVIIDLETTTVINEFEVEVLSGSTFNALSVNADFSTVLRAVYRGGAVGNEPSGTEFIDPLTGELLRTVALGRHEPLKIGPPIAAFSTMMLNDAWHSKRYYITYLSDAVSPGVFDLETGELVLSLEGRTGVRLVGDGQYVSAQDPCTVWELP